MKWFERSFPQGLPAWHLAHVVERLRGTPARLEERVAQASPAALTAHVDGAWSAQQNAGHLLDLEPLWSGRVDDLCAGAEVLREADLENTKTHQADHDAADLATLLADFRAARGELVAALERLGPDGAELSALHPRLRQPMRLVDLAFFVAEHDDAHLAEITRLLP